VSSMMMMIWVRTHHDDADDGECSGAPVFQTKAAGHKADRARALERKIVPVCVYIYTHTTDPSRNRPSKQSKQAPPRRDLII
jgi:hypothetical protein